MDNTIRAVTDTGQETEIYTNKISELFDEYKNSLDDPEEDIRRSTAFAGAMRYIYEHLFHPHEVQMNYRHTIIDTGNITLLDRIWSVYTDLCYRHGIRPTMLRFSLLTGISGQTFDNWRTGRYRNASPAHVETLKKWMAECESSAFDSVLQNNSVGGIFIMKSCYGYRETAPSTPQEIAPVAHDSAEQIAQRHAGAVLPEKIDLD